MKRIIDTLYETADLNDEDIRQLLEADSSVDEYLFQRADYRRQEIYGRDVYLRGLIEFTNFCKNDCYYCGIRRGNRTLERYRLTKEEILAAVILDTDWGIAPLFSREERILITQTDICARLSEPYMKNILTVPSHYQLEKEQRTAIRPFLMPGPYDICFAMRQLTKLIMRVYILKR